MIRRIRIQNFRSIRDVTVDLDPLTVLIGSSGTGKSNFVKAIRLLRDMLLTRQIPPTLTWLPAFERGFQINSPPLLSFLIEYGIDGSKIDQAYELVIEANYKQPVVFTESLVQNGKLVFSFTRSNQKNIGLSLGSIPNMRESTIAYRYLTSNIGCYDFPSNVLEASNVFPIAGPTAGYLDRGQNYLPVAKGIFESLNDHFAWKSMESSIKAVNQSATGLMLNHSALRSDQPKEAELEIGSPYNHVETWENVSEESEGLRRYLAHLLALNQDPPKRIAVFEHPEMGIHPHALHALFDEFENFVDRERGQVILTTHSPQFLDHFKPGQIRVVDIQNQSTQIGPLAPEQVESVREKWLLPSELLTVDLARRPGQLAEMPQ